MKSTFSNVGRIAFEGPRSKNPLAFKHYNPDEFVEGRTMHDHLRFAVVYWHTFRGTGSDPFGAGTMQRPWDDGSNSVSNAQDLARRLMPPSRDYGHEQAWHDGNGHSHLQATTLGPSLSVPIGDGRLLLGTWQQIVHLECDTRGRERTIVVTVMGE